MGKRLRVSKSICSCASPRYSSSSVPPFSRHDIDVWTEIAKRLDGKSLVMLAATNKWFLSNIMEDFIWKFVCLRDLQIPDCDEVKFKWIKIYGSAFDGSHSYSLRQKDKHIDWMRIGAFSFDSPDAFLTEKLIRPTKLPVEDTKQNMLDSDRCCLVHNVKTGMWIADLQLVRCPVCNLNTCDGTMQVLDARHAELFLNEGYKNGSWEYKPLGSHDIKRNVNSASGAILDIKHFKSPSTTDLFNLKSWVGKPNDWQPKATVADNAVAINTNLQDNEGLQIKYHVMTSGDTDEVVAIRISQQLL
ncbi:putative F-box protein At3g61730 [Bidens hawaiensis]|uniref:putative F-box protein At3g61730 n=1 Tax=Bidens hawaiensis TaxID=980011 RepID=UPI00404A508F